MMSAMLREWKHPYYTRTITVWFIQTSPSNNMIVNLENNYLQVNETTPQSGCNPNNQIKRPLAVCLEL